MEPVQIFLEAYTQYIGLIAALLMVMRYQFSSARLLKLSTMVGAFFFMLHYIGLGQTAAAMLCIIAVFRSGFLSTNWGMKHRKWIASAIIISAVSAGAFFWSGWLSILPVMGIVIYTFAEVQTCGKRLRIMAFVPPSIWLVFNLFTGSYGGVISNIAGISSNVLGIYRHYFRKKKRNA
jgi:hypothetical protein